MSCPENRMGKPSGSSCPSWPASDLLWAFPCTSRTHHPPASFPGIWPDSPPMCSILPGSAASCTQTKSALSPGHPAWAGAAPHIAQTAGTPLTRVFVPSPDPVLLGMPSAPCLYPFLGPGPMDIRGSLSPGHTQWCHVCPRGLQDCTGAGGVRVGRKSGAGMTQTFHHDLNRGQQCGVFRVTGTGDN